MKRVVVPIDYSAYSKNALKVAIDLVKDLGLNEITLLRADPLPVPYMITGAGWSYEKFCRDVRAVAESKLEDFIEPLNFKKISTSKLFLVDSSAGQAILTAIQKHRFDLCIIGAKGKNALAAFFLGSTAEEVLRAAKIPVLIVRPKDET
jgi:nucleotide-binding universal stress UspA family protein